MSSLLRARSAAERLSSTNSWIVVLSVLGSLVLVLVGLMTFGQPLSPVYIALGLAGVVWSILTYQLIEAFSQKVLISTEILMELEKSNGSRK